MKPLLFLFVVIISAGAQAQVDLGELSANPYAPDSTANPYGQHGSPYGSKSARNPYATQAPRLISP